VFLELTPDDFFYAENRNAFFCMKRLADRDEPVEVVATAMEYEQQFNVNALPYLFNLHDSFCSLRSASEKADQAIALIQAVQQSAMYEHSQDGASAQADYIDELERRLELDGQIDGLATGLTALDHKLKGLKPGQLVVLGARPGAGKTALALNIAQHAAIHQNKQVLFFSLEMGKTEITDRLVASHGNYLLQAIKSAEVLQYGNVLQTVKTVFDAPLKLYDSADMSLAKIGAIARKHQYQYGLDLLVIDYLQLLGGDNPRDSSYDRTSKISRAAKLLAKSLNVPVVLLSQLSRNNESRANKRPIAADLRDSGSIEQDADVIVFIYRDEMYHEDSPNKGTAELIVNKGRNIETGTVHVAWRGAYSCFADLPEDWQPQEKVVPIASVKSTSRRFGRANDYAKAKWG